MIDDGLLMLVAASLVISSANTIPGTQKLMAEIISGIQFEIIYPNEVQRPRWNHSHDLSASAKVFSVAVDGDEDDGLYQKKNLHLQLGRDLFISEKRKAFKLRGHHRLLRT